MNGPDDITLPHPLLGLIGDVAPAALVSSQHDPQLIEGLDSCDSSNPRAKTLAEQAYRSLRQHIIEGVYPPGAKLRVEHLKDDYGVGAGTLREALNRLVSDALVIAEGQRGFRVTPMSLADLADITQLRIHIEVDTLRQSVRRGGKEWEMRVRSSFERLSSYEQPVSLARRSDWELCNRQFHDALISAAASPWTHLILRILSQHGERYRRLCIGMPQSQRDVHREHTEIFEAALRRADARAALALEDHISTTLVTLQSLPPDQSPLR